MYWANRWQGLRCRQQGIGTLQLAGEGEGLDPFTLQRGTVHTYVEESTPAPPPLKKAPLLYYIQ